MPSIHIINPRPLYPSYADPDAIGEAGFGNVIFADLTIVTVAAFVPAEWDVQVTDEAITPLDLERRSDFVAITGKTTQRSRMIEVAAEARSRGAVVVIGGPLASLDPDELRLHADVLVTGELEEIAPRLFADLEAGRWEPIYEGGRADIRLSPLPRWDLYPVEGAQMGALQTTRGCPFECEFCDVIQYQGRKQRHKSPDQVLAELDLLYRHGFRKIMIVDDNFTVHRSFARAMLRVMASFNDDHQGDPVQFATQASLDVARDPELLNLCEQAGLRMLLIGIETINEESLRETRKRQNLLQPAGEAVRRVLEAGISIRAAIMVGFDHDGPDIFDTLFAFLQSAPLPDVLLNVLNAGKATPLHRRLSTENRLTGEYWGHAFETNIVPRRMTRVQLENGARDLARRLYDPDAFGERLVRLVDMLGRPATLASPRSGPLPSARAKMMMRVLRRISSMGLREARMVSDVLAAAAVRPWTMQAVMSHLTTYLESRRFVDRYAGPGPQVFGSPGLKLAIGPWPAIPHGQPATQGDAPLRISSGVRSGEGGGGG